MNIKALSASKYYLDPKRQVPLISSIFYLFLSIINFSISWAIRLQNYNSQEWNALVKSDYLAVFYANFQEASLILLLGSLLVAYCLFRVILDPANNKRKMIGSAFLVAFAIGILSIGFQPSYALTAPTSINPSLMSSTVNCSSIDSYCVYTTTVSATTYYGASNSTGVQYGYQSTLYPNQGGATGTNFSSVIDLTLSEVSGQHGGLISLTSGIFYVSSGSIWIGNNTQLEGSGENSTFIYPTTALGNVPVICGNDCSANQAQHGDVIQDLTINGASHYGTAGTANGINWYSDSGLSTTCDPPNTTCSGYSLETYNVMVENMEGSGFLFQQGINGNGWVFAQYSRSVYNQGYGFYLVSPDSVLLNDYSYTNGTRDPVLYVVGGTDTIEGGYFGGNGDTNTGEVTLDHALSPTFIGTIIDECAGPCFTAQDGTVNVTYFGGLMAGGYDLANNNTLTLITIGGGTYGLSYGITFSGVKFGNDNPTYLPASLLKSTNTNNGRVIFDGCQISISIFGNPNVLAIATVNGTSVSIVNSPNYEPFGATPTSGHGSYGSSGGFNIIEDTSGGSGSPTNITTYTDLGDNKMIIITIDSGWTSSHTLIIRVNGQGFINTNEPEKNSTITLFLTAGMSYYIQYQSSQASFQTFDE